MRIKVKAIVHASKDALERLGDNSYKVWVRAIPEKGQANLEIQKLLALEFEVKPSQIFLVSGSTSATKVFEVMV